MSFTNHNRISSIVHSNDISLFDIQTNIVVSLPKEMQSNIESIISILDSCNKNCNADTLVNFDYEDGSNFTLNINLTPACNLKCVYCFAQGGDYGSRQSINMKDDIIEKLEKIILNNVTPSRTIRFEFFGGEPLLNFLVMKKIVTLGNIIQQREGIRFIYRISTNLTVLTDEMVKLLGENNFIVSVSIDGKQNVQDKLRPFKNGQGSYNIIIENAKKLKNAYPNLRLVARMTIAQKEVELYDNISELIYTGLFSYVSLYPASVKDEVSGAYSYFFDDDIKKQYLQVIDKYEKLFDLSPCFMGILEFDKIIYQILNGYVSISHCAAGGTYFTISQDSTIVPCHRLCGKTDFFIDKTKGKLNSDSIKDWYGTVDNRPICSQCWAKYICGGGCRQEHFSANGNIVAVNAKSCEYHKFLIENIIASFTRRSKYFLAREIAIDDMFVYCGRPIVKNKRNLTSLEERLRSLNANLVAK